MRDKTEALTSRRALDQSVRALNVAHHHSVVFVNGLPHKDVWQRSYAPACKAGDSSAILDASSKLLKRTYAARGSFLL